MPFVGAWRRGRWSAVCLTAGALALCGFALAVPAASGNHPQLTPADELGLTEAQLRDFEIATLGPAHAAEHAEQREMLREQGEISPAITAEAPVEAQALAAGPPDQVGEWGSPFSIPVFGIHAVVLPTGKVLWWSYPQGTGEPRANTSQAWLWEPSTGAMTRVDPPQIPDPDNPGQTKAANIFCAGQVMLQDGRVLVVGGNLDYGVGVPGDEFRGLKQLYTFNPFNETWTEQPSMSKGRWYPSAVSQPDGRVVIMDGYDDSGTPAKNDTIEVFTPSPDLDGVGQVTTVALRGGPGQPPDRELYPRNFLMPSGRTVIAGPDPGDTWYFNQIGPAPGNAFSWGELPNLNGGQSRLWGSSVLDPGPPSGSTKVMALGGDAFNGTTQRTTETFDDSNHAQGWVPGASMNIGRSHMNTVLLPDASKVVVGGGVGFGEQGLYTYEDEQRQIEIYDPVSNSWRLGPAQAEGRAYHSTAALLPDGRVVSAGDNLNGTIGQPDGDRTDTAELYSPPYLFKGARPAISAAPQSVAWGDTFGVHSPDPVSRAVMMAPAATTHGYDMNQRHVELQVANTVPGTGIDVVSPPSGRVAQPGYYMLFLLNGQGVPSVAKWVRLDPGAPDRPTLSGGPPPPPPDRTLTVTPPGGTGTGTITGTGINCPGDCNQAYPDGTAVTLTATPTGGSTFAGWSGACTGTGPCNLTMSVDRAVSGTFTAAGGGPGGTQLLRPSGDVTSQWNVFGPSAWDALNDDVTQAQTTIPSEQFIYASALNTTTEVAFSDAPLNGVPATSRAWFYGNTAPGENVRADVIWGGAVRGSTTVPAAQGYSWRSVAVTPPDQAAADDLRIRFTVSNSASSSSGNLFAAYFELVTTAGGPPPPPPNRTLAVTPPSGTGTGAITGTGISCPGDCTETYPDGTAVTLSANPTGGSTFAGWTGDCSGTGPCNLTMTANRSVSAVFNSPGGGPGGTQLLRPNADITSQWTVCCLAGTPAWDALDENVTQAQTSIPSEQFLYASALGTTTEVAFSNTALNGTPATSAAWFYGNTAPGQNVRADVLWGGEIRASTTVAGAQSYGWRAVPVTVPNQAAADDLRIRFTVSGAASSSSGNLFASYFELVSDPGPVPLASIDGAGAPPAKAQAKAKKRKKKRRKSKRKR